MIDQEYKSNEEAWWSGYDAALYCDFPDALFDNKPWWYPNWAWRRLISRVVDRVNYVSGEGRI